MTATQFDEVLSSLSLAQPFRAFTIEFEDGKRLEVDFPLAIRDGVAVYLAARGGPTILRHSEVRKVIPAAVTSDA